MTIKPFAIQGSDLTLGGVNLQAGATAVVIPGVTQAVNYRVEEVDDRDGNNPDIFGSDVNAVTVIDHAEYLYQSGEATASGSYDAASYSVDELDDGEIEEINVEYDGIFLSADVANIDRGNMWATTVADPLLSFNANDWTEIPFRPKMRAGEVENVGGGSGADTGDFVFSNNFLTAEGEGIDQIVIQGETDGDARIDIPNNDQAENSKALEIKNYAAQGVKIISGQDNEWAFKADGGLAFPDGTIQTTAYTGQTSGGGTGELYIMANVDGDIVTSTNGVDWTDPQPSGMSGIGRVEIHGGVIVYITNGGEGPPSPGLYYSTQLGAVTLCAGTAVSVETGDNLYWNEVHYFSATDKWVAVGYNAGDNNNFPVLAHSDDGITWTVVFVDNTFVTGFNPGNDGWELRDVVWLDETSQYVITSSLDGELFGGIFLTSDITTALDGTNHVAIDLDAGHVAPWSVQGLGGPPGYMVIIPASNDGPDGGADAWFGYGTDVVNYAESFEGGWTGAIVDQIGYMPNITEVAYRNGNFIAVTNDGHVITPVFSMGPEFAVTIPVPFTSTTFSITNANPAVISFPSGEAAKNNEKIEVTLAGEYNGTYYVNTATGVLYTDQAMTTALDASGFASFTTGTVTFSHGQYFDAAGVSNSYYYIGNDDEKIFRSSNGVSWTEQADFTGEYFNDFAYGSWGTSSSSTAIPNTKRGWINLVGDKPNNEDDAWFESVVVHGGYAYVLGSDQYIDNSGNRNKVYKFDVATGEQVWVKQITAGRNATFDLTVDAGVVTISAVATSGVGYKVGEEIVIQGYQINGSDPQNNVTLIVDSIDVDGGVLTASVKPGYNVVGISGTFTGLASNNDDARGDACAIAYDEYNQKLVVVTQYESGSGDVTDSTWTWANVYMMNPTTGAIDSTTTISEDGDIYPNSITTHNSAGGIAIVGEKYNEYREFGTLTILDTYNGYFDILKTELDAEHYPGSPFDYYGDFWITGTGITGQQQISNINYYENLSPTTREGSGATFNIADDGAGGYSLVAINSGGTNYLVGHKIKILGSYLGGTDVANDAIITVTTVDAGAITAGTITGVSFSTAPAEGWTVGGINYNVGSGATFTVSVDAATGAFTLNGLTGQGSNYVVGDVLTIPGTAFAGGTSPTNDATLVVAAADVFGLIGNIVDYAATGTGPTTAIRIFVNGIDFTVEGSWSMRQNLGGEAFIWTPDWSNAIGGPSGDRFMDVCWEDAGTALYAVGRGRYETTYTQALVVKFNDSTGAVMWSKDIKFSEAGSNNREARAVCLVPGSTDILVAGGWYNNDNNGGNDELILTRMTDAGDTVWQKTYSPNFDGNTFSPDWEISVKPTNNNIVVSFEQTTDNNRGLAYMIVDTSGQVVLHRVVSSDGNSNYNYYDTPTANFADIYTDENLDQYIVIAGYTYVPSDNYQNALLMKLPLDGLKDIAIGEKWSLGEHIMTRHDISVTTVTSASDSFTPTEHEDTMTNSLDARNYTTRTPDGLLNVWKYQITDDAAGYLEFGDGSKQSFATNIIPQIPAANDYWLTDQDSGKHIFYEHENGSVYIPHSSVRYFPVGFTFTIVNITGNDCYLYSQGGEWTMAEFKLAGRNITTTAVGIPDSGSGSMVTVMKIKDGYTMSNSDNNNTYPDIWIVSGPGDLYQD